MKTNFYVILLTLFLAACTKHEYVFDDYANSNFELDLILSLNGNKCFLDSQSGTLKYSLSSDNLDDFSPFTVFESGSQISFEGQELANNKINNLGNVILNKPYNLTVKTTSSIHTFKLIFTNLPLVQIINFDDIKNEPKLLSKLLIQSPKGPKEGVNTYVGIEVRGKSSLSNPKKSYGFKVLENKNMKSSVSMPFFDMSPNSKWSLDAMYIDQSKNRNKTSFEIWNSLSNSSIKSKYVEVFLNNKSLGLYRFSENYTEELLQLENDASIYVGLDNSDYTKFKKLPKNEPKSAIWTDWRQYFPNPKTAIYWNDFYALNTLIVEGSNQQFINEIENHMDMDNLIDYYLFMNLCYGYDNVGKNWYFMKRSASEKFEILLWDMDATWGRNHKGQAISSELLISNSLFERLVSLNPNEFNQKIKTRWTQLRTNQFSRAVLIDKFDSNFKQVSQSEIIETENGIWNTSVNLDTEQLYINNWIIDRLLFLDDYYDAL